MSGGRPKLMRVPRCKNFWRPGLFSTRHTAATHSVVGWGGWPANLVREMMPACYAITVSRHLRKALAPPEQHRTKEHSENPGGSRPRIVGGPSVKIRTHETALASLATRDATTRMLADLRPTTHNTSSTASNATQRLHGYDSKEPCSRTSRPPVRVHLVIMGWSSPPSR